ncbi:hypothetical protein D3C76_1116270 [compost metagenome]
MSRNLRAIYRVVCDGCYLTIHCYQEAPVLPWIKEYQPGAAVRGDFSTVLGLPSRGTTLIDLVREVLNRHVACVDRKIE